MTGRLLAGVLLSATLLPAQPASPSERESLAVSYPEGSNVNVTLAGTMRLPNAKAEARVQRRPGAAEIQVRLQNMKPALLFGGDFATYVFWTVSPEGVAVNAGEVVLDGHRANLRVSTPLSTFGMFVTAEPHFLVRRPSQMIVLENTEVGLIRGRVTTSRVKYRGFDGEYKYDQESLIREERMRGDLRADRQQAMMAVALAERSGAQQWAPDELRRASESLSATVAAFAEGASIQRLSELGHNTVRLAVEAQELAEKRSREAAEAAQRQEMDSLRVAIEESNRARAAAEAAAADARTQTEVARVEQQKALEAKQAAEQAVRIAETEQRQAQDLMERARQETQKLERLRSMAERDAAVARQEADELRRRMLTALSRVAETTDTARGLIVNLPDILFDTGQATLRLEAREVLSRVAGVLLVASDYPLSVEGHTDSTGSAALNQTLSEKRADAVRTYLIEAQVPAEIIRTRGFGQDSPVASNATAAGRQKNRRVEIVIGNLEE